MADNLKYVVGVDVGTHSIGTVAIEVDDHGYPLSLLNAVVHIHDSGVDPDSGRDAHSRLATAGVARRTRRLLRRRRRRLQQLDAMLESMGYPLPDLAERSDPHTPWVVRARLVAEQIEDAEERAEMISIALRHIARHRGWRSPYERVQKLYGHAPDSDELIALKERVAAELQSGVDLTEATPAEVITSLDMYNTKIRGPKGILGGKLRQSDNANEIRLMCEVQGIGQEDERRFIDAVFKAETARGSSAELIGFDALPGQGHRRRASKAQPSYQRFKIVSILTNLRIREGKGQSRRLTPEEVQQAAAMLISTKHTENPIWADVAELLGVERPDLLGTAIPTADGDRAAARPPLDETSRRLRLNASKAVKQWWQTASDDEQAEFIIQLTDGIPSEIPEVFDFFESLSDEDLTRLDNFHLPSGRAAYSIDSLDRLVDHMLHEGSDLHEARMAVFGVDEYWKPPVPRIGEPVGNPTVDRVLKQLARWLQAVERRWGAPLSINIEHVRDGFSSKAVSNELNSQYNRRRVINEKLVADMRERLALSGRVTRRDIIRFSAVERQNSQCAYCGTTVNFFTNELDHIVPRSGLGSTNRRDNLVAVCVRCNRDKSDIPFATWADKTEVPGVSLAGAIERVKFWNFPAGQMNKAQQAAFKREVITRLKQRVSDPPLDGRSMESVAWMANELHARVAAHFPDSKVRVYRGAITAGARKVSGLEKKIRFHGERGKTRLDRRHHAFDAACIAMMRPKVAEILTLRSNLRESQQLSGVEETWKRFTGENHADQFIFDTWLKNMSALGDLFNEALDSDNVIIRENLRLRLANSAAHKVRKHKFVKRALSAAFKPQEIDKAGTPALWCALTRLPDYDHKEGLRADPHRRIVVNGRHLGPENEVDLFEKSSASIGVQGGYAEVGNTIHHSRIYRIDDKGKNPTYGMMRVYQQDLLRNRNDDLFSVDLPPQSLSMRYCNRTVRTAIIDGRTTYLGWIVVGDEVEVADLASAKGIIADFLEVFPGIRRWRIDGLESPGNVRLRPVQLASEGLPPNAPPAVRSIVNLRGWRISVNQFFGEFNVRIIRRTSLGEERADSRAKLPIGWES